MAGVSMLADVSNTSTITESVGGSSQPLLQSLLLVKVSRYVTYIGSPLILLLGNFGNVMTIIIMRRMPGESVVKLCFTGLAVVDLIILDVYVLCEWVGGTFRFAVKNINDVFCKLYTWVTAGCIPISAWILVCLTVHRAISVVWPHRVNLLCTRRRIVGLLTVVTFVFASLYSHTLYGFNIMYSKRFGISFCTMLQGNYAKFMDMFMYVDLVFTSLLPFLCLVFANGVMVWKLRTSAKEAGRSFAAGQSQVSEARQSTARSVTRTVIAVSTAFIVLTLPVCFVQVLYYVASVTGAMSVYQQAEFYFVNNVTFKLMFCNSAVNFYLYCLTGRRFREEFMNIISCGGVQRSTDVSSESGDSTKKVTRQA